MTELSTTGGDLSAWAIAFRVAELAERAGLKDVSPHTLRHSFAKNLVDAGVGLEDEVPLAFIQQVFDVMRQVDWHTFRVLTKTLRTIVGIARATELAQQCLDGGQCGKLRLHISH